MQCQALTVEKRRCPDAAQQGADWCAAHAEEMTRVANRNRATRVSHLGKVWAWARGAPNPLIPDGATYAVPGWLRDAPTPDVMVQLRTASDSMVRWMAAFVLRKRRAVQAIEPLWETLQSDPVRFVRQQSAVALGKIGVPAVYAPLVESLHHDHDPGVREACAIALGNLGNPAAADEIAYVLELEENVFVKWDCIVALGQLGDRRFDKLLGRLQAEEIAQVLRDACRDALAEIHSRDRIFAA